jgi:hypothetical protein
MGLPAEVAFPLAIACLLAIEIAGTWLLYWLYMCARFYHFFFSRKDQYDMDQPSFFEAMRERERFSEDFAASLDGDPIMLELWHAYRWPRTLLGRIAPWAHACQAHYHTLLFLVDRPHLYQRYLRRSRFRHRELLWRKRSVYLARVTMLRAAWTLLDRGDAWYSLYRTARYLWTHPQIRARYLRRRRARKLRSRSTGKTCEPGQ